MSGRQIEQGGRDLEGRDRGGGVSAATTALRNSVTFGGRRVERSKLGSRNEVTSFAGTASCRVW